VSHAQPSGCGCLAPLFSPVPPGAHWPQEKALAGNHQILGFLDVRDVLSSFLAGVWASVVGKWAGISSGEPLHATAAAVQL
jgi:hypothetical protein